MGLFGSRALSFLGGSLGSLFGGLSLLGLGSNLLLGALSLLGLLFGLLGSGDLEGSRSSLSLGLGLLLVRGLQSLLDEGCQLDGVGLVVSGDVLIVGGLGSLGLVVLAFISPSGFLSLADFYAWGHDEPWPVVCIASNRCEEGSA